MGVLGEPGLPPAYVILGKPLPSLGHGARGLDFPTQYVGQGTIHSFEDSGDAGLYREEMAQASEPQFKF